MRDQLVFLAATALFLVLTGTAGATAHDSHTAGTVATGHASIVVDASEVTGAIRSLLGINAGPHGNDRQSRLSCQYRDIGVDDVQIHDDVGAADMHTLPPDLAADPDDEASHHFVAAECELEAISRVGARAVFRLGESSSSGATVAPAAVVLADGPGGLELVSAPATLPLSVGQAAYLPIEVQGYHRPIAVSAQALVHTYVNDVTAVQPGESPPRAVGQLVAAQSELKLQTLRLRNHTLTLVFSPVEQVGNPSHDTTDALSTTIVIQAAVTPRTPLFGVHCQPFYDGPPAPFIQVWGPSCGSCPTTAGDPSGSTRDILCARQQDSCGCYPVQKIYDPEADARTRRSVPRMQRYASQFLRSMGGWGQVQIEPGRYLWEGLDWIFYDLSPEERDYSPLFTGIIYGNFGWMTCPEYTNPDGSRGFYDPGNGYLLEQYGEYVRELTARYAPELRFIETGNEPSYEFYLCPCLDPGGPPCNAESGPDQPACALGPASEAFAQVYGPFLSTSANVAAGAMAEANPGALLIAGALEKSGEGLTATTRYMIEHGLLDRGNVAVMIHQFPLPSPNWLSELVNCAYYQDPNDPWWLPAGCETAPPFDDYVTPAGRPIHAQETWREIDEKIDAGPLLHDAEDMGVLDEFYLFDTELHAGFHDTLAGAPNEATTPAREAMIGLRIGAINAHQRYLGLQFGFAPADPAVFNVMVQHLAGATPVYAWDAPLIDANYSGLVYKLFTRGDEDIIAIWSNADVAEELTLTLSTSSTRFKQVTLTSLAGAQDTVAITSTNPDLPPVAIPVQPLREFCFLSVISDQPGFGWLADLEASPVEPRSPRRPQARVLPASGTKAR